MRSLVELMLGFASVYAGACFLESAYWAHRDRRFIRASAYGIPGAVVRPWYMTRRVMVWAVVTSIHSLAFVALVLS